MLELRPILPSLLSIHISIEEIHLKIIGNKAINTANIILGNKPVTIPNMGPGISKINFKNPTLSVK